jgi:hypothetical protein
MQNRVSPILKSIKFSSQSDDSSLNQAIDHFRDKNGVLDESAPMEFLKPDERTAVMKGKFRISLYKALLFIHVRIGIKSGTLNLNPLSPPLLRSKGGFNALAPKANS